MDVFLTLVLKIIPLYGLILMGYVAGKVFKIDNKSIAVLSIYVITPMVVFNGVSHTRIDWNIIFLPVLFFTLASLMCLLFYALGKNLWRDETKNILAFTAGTGNTGYFGLPVAILLFGDHMLGLAVIAALGFTLYENSVGFFITARGHHSIRESVIKVVALPTVYAFWVGLIVSLSGFGIPENLQTILDKFVGAYTVIGMMIIGLGLAAVKRTEIDKRFISMAFLARFLVWPTLMFFVLWLDKSVIHFFTPSIHRIMILMSVVPLAANTVAVAETLNTQPGKAAVAVLLTTLFALVYIPLIVMWIF